MKVSFDFFKRKIEREILAGVYTEYQFDWLYKRYCINSDLDKFYIYNIKPTSDKVNEEDMLLDFYLT